MPNKGDKCTTLGSVALMCYGSGDQRPVTSHGLASLESWRITTSITSPDRWLLGIFTHSDVFPFTSGWVIYAVFSVHNNVLSTITNTLFVALFSFCVTFRMFLFGPPENRTSDLLLKRQERKREAQYFGYDLLLIVWIVWCVSLILAGWVRQSCQSCN